MKTIATMQANVGRICENDTSTTFATLALGWLNDKYNDAWNRFCWSAKTNNDYTQVLVSGTAEYDLPLDFGEEIACSDITDGFPLKKYTERLWWEDRTGAYSGGSITGGTSGRYKILLEKVNSTGSGFGVIQFDPTPNNTHTIALPYVRKAQKLISVTGTCTTNTVNKIIASASTFITSGVEKGMRVKNTTLGTYSVVSSVDSETQLTMETDVCPSGTEGFEVYTSPIITDLGYCLECGAISDGLTYKKQFAKAGDYLQKYEYELGKRIGQENRKPNMRAQWIPETDSRQGYPTPFTGWQSYDSL